MDYIKHSSSISKMRILQLHVDFIEFVPTQKEISNAESLTTLDRQRFEEAVVILISFEKGDNDEAIQDLINEVDNYLRQIKCSSVVIYPYAHLSSNLENPNNAYSMFNKVYERLGEKLPEIGFFKAPFGWTKELNLKIKGHPLAENAKSLPKKKIYNNLEQPEKLLENQIITNLKNEHESNALSAETKLKSYWYILNTEGELIPYDKYRFKKDQKGLESLLNYEIVKKRNVDEQPPHVKLMRKLGIADYEPASDSGNMRYYPKGRLLKSLLEQFVTRRVMSYGGLEVETPIMYDSHHPSMESYFNRFPARQYNITSDQKELFLRFAACFGQFLMTKDFQISYKNLPLKLYELTRYSFRREKSGELVGLRRLRAFSMPDCHAFCTDIDQAKVEFLKRLDLSISVVEDIGLSLDNDLEMAIRFTEDFYTNNKEFIKKISKKIKKPILVEMWKERFFYFILKWEFNYIDNLGKASALSTDQIDIENGERYGIFFVDENGNKKNPIILHNSPSGAIERVIFALLEKSAKLMKTGNTPYLPLWLMNTQVRIIPVSDEHINYCWEILKVLKENQIRVDIDDRQDTLSKRIRDAETEWIHYIIIVGENEVSSKTISVRERLEKKNYQITVDELIQNILQKVKDKPTSPINLPELVSIRPKIVS